MQCPKVSVLIPVYNRESLLRSCIQSALDQTVTEIEVVVVDNASTDGTWAICREFAAADPRVRVFRNESNVGPVRNWQRCIEEARGVYGKILFSDDAISPTYLEKTLPLLANDQVGFVFTPSLVGPEPDHSKVKFEFAHKTGRYPSRQFIAELLFEGSVPYSPGSALFRLEDLKKNLVNEIPSPTLSNFSAHGAGPDLLIYLLTAKDYPEIGFVAEPLSFFRAHEGSITVSDRSFLIRRCYRQAKIWFTEEFLGRDLCNKVYAYEWRREYKESKNYTRPSVWLASYSDRGHGIDWLDIFWAFVAKSVLKKSCTS